MQEKQQAPVALKKAHTLHHLNHKRQDPYFWMNQRDSPEVLEYLEAENRYYESQIHQEKRKFRSPRGTAI